MYESHDRKWAVCACCVIAALGLAIRAPADELALWKKDFKNPPLALKTIPLWAMNGKLTREEIASQLKAARDISGFAGVAVLPVSQTEPEYLTEDYFARYGDILETSKKLGMSVVFYDDVDFPSGTAGGRMTVTWRCSTITPANTSSTRCPATSLAGTSTGSPLAGRSTLTWTRSGAVIRRLCRAWPACVSSSSRPPSNGPSLKIDRWH